MVPAAHPDVRRRHPAGPGLHRLHVARRRRRLARRRAGRGAGKSLFGRADRDKQMLTLRESESYSNGILKLVYDVTRSE
ncbi:hypothetical protein GCM10025331_37740 [Actinoplanes utahensis]|nr:hypothetical protein Aut01nite_45950 [Actinoplanes utahensis]